MAKRLKLNIGDDGKFTVSELCKEVPAQELGEAKRKVGLKGAVVSGEDTKLYFVPEDIFADFDEFFKKIYEKLSGMGLTDANTNNVVELSSKLIEAHENLILKSLKKEDQANDEIVATIKEASQHSIEQLKKIGTASTRLNEFRKNPLFVEPKDVALTLKWQTKVYGDRDLPSHSLIQSTYQFVSIIKTLIAIFSQPDFESMYTNYNSKEKHQCQGGVYVDFCCGSTYKKKDIFKDEDIIQIQLGMDDFEICCSVKTKATKHKICGIYFQIRNLPENIVSKIENIFLVALVSSEDLKNDAILNEVVEIIVEELLILETIGFKTIDGKHWKAALINISCDNLGANFVFGFSKGFNAHYYCRICEMTRVECQQTTYELTERLRSTLSHQEHIEFLKENPNCELRETKGVRMACLFNKLNSYDIFENVSLDIMHDIHEGIIPFFLSSFFDLCISKKIDTEENIFRKIRDFNHGPLFEKKKPSLVNLTRHNLGQNASQSYCVMVHLPYIFIDLKDKLISIWPTLEALLKCLNIVMSIKITEEDLKHLEENIESFLTGMLTLKGKLIPKAHLLLHYPNAIRKVGPLKHMWTMRFECKHQFFTNAAKNTKNFINIKKTLALKSQEKICLKGFAIKDHIEESKRKILIRAHNQFPTYESFLCSIDVNVDLDRLFILPFLSFNNYTYKSGLVLIENFLVYEILFVLKSRNDYYFLCELYEINDFEHSLNSIEIRPSCPDRQLAYLVHSELTNLQTFPKKICNGKIYVMAENLTVFNTSNNL